MVLVTEPKRHVPLHHKKRVGQHHKQSSRYSKTYWPYLPLLLIVAGGVLLSNAWTSQSKGVLGYSVDVSPTTLLQDTNVQRTTGKEAALQLNSQLMTAAQTKAEDMTKLDYWSHVSPSGEQPWQFIANTGYTYTIAGENLAFGFGSSNAVITAWMHSAAHRANILNGAYQAVGFGIANSPDFQSHGPETVVVAMYAEPAAGAVTTTSHEVLGAETTQSVSRIQLFGIGQNPWLFGMITALAGAAVGIFIVRHGLLWKRALAKSEVFVVKHHILDAALITIGIAGFILTRSAGSIG